MKLRTGNPSALEMRNPVPRKADQHNHSRDNPVAEAGIPPKQHYFG